MAETASVLMVLESVFPPTGGGGAEAQVATLGRHLRRIGIHVRVLVPMVAKGPQLRTERVGDIDVERIPYPKIRRVGALIMLVRLALRLVRERRRYAVIHAHIGGNMAAVCCITGRLLGRPVVVKLTGLTEMAGGVLDPRAGLGASIRRAALRRASAFQATSSRIVSLLQQGGFDAAKVHLIPNAVDTERFRPAEHPRVAADGGTTLVYVGRLVPEKGLELLLRAWSRVARDSRATLRLVGSGVSEAGLRQLAHDLGTAHSVQFAGATADVAGFLHDADVAVLASGQEGLSNSLLEYMGCGLPVIGSRVSGTEDFVADGSTGWVFTPGDIDGLTTCIAAALAAPPELRAAMGRRARAEVQARASVDSVCRRLIALYDGLAPAGRRSGRA